MVQNHLPHDHGQTIEQARNFHHMIEWLVKRRIQSYRSKTSKDSKRHPRLEALPGWWNGYHTLWRTVSSGYRWKRVYGGI